MSARTKAKRTTNKKTKTVRAPRAGVPKTPYGIAAGIAEYYGFEPLGAAFAGLESEGGKSGIKLPASLRGRDNGVDRPALIKALVESGSGNLSQPLLIYHSEPLPRDANPKDYGGAKGIQFSLEIIGSGRAIAEALLMQAARAIAEELGFVNFRFHLNSLGDRESIARFNREFSAYANRHMEELPGVCRTHLRKRDVFKTLECIDAHDECDTLTEEAPKPISCLSEESRTHFAEVLEYAEGLDVPYQVNNCLVGGKDFYSKTIIELRAQDGEQPFGRALPSTSLGRGARYDTLARKCDYKKDIPAIGMSFLMGGAGFVEQPAGSAKARELRKGIYLLHIGFPAKVKSLQVLELLRKAKVPVAHSLIKDRLGAQIGAVERIEVPYTVIIGQREALENTAIVREMKNRSQVTVPLSELPKHLRTIL